MSERAMKRRAGERAADLVESGMVVGLGTGSTAAFAIECLGERVSSGLSIRGVPTSYQARDRAIEEGIPIVDLDQVDGVSMAIDGADQVVDATAVKGGGAAHAREKLVASAAAEFVVVVDETKLAGAVNRPIPVEILPAARSVVGDRIRALGGSSTLRSGSGKDGPVITDNGNLVLDCTFEDRPELGQLARTLSTIPGVVEHGLFVDMIDTVVVGGTDEATVSRL